MKLASIVLLLALPAISTGEHVRDDLHQRCVKRVKVIARALKEYANRNKGALPHSVKDLAPKYLQATETWIPLLNARHSRGIQMVIAGIPLRTSTPMLIIAYSSIPDPDGMRFVIDHLFQVTRCGEVAFQRLLAGEKEQPRRATR